jgi:hypothetical protein
MSNVEQARAIAHMTVASDYPIKGWMRYSFDQGVHALADAPILERHRVASKGYHFCLISNMKVI